jgi:hypothetical protein
MVDQIKSFDPSTGASKILARQFIEGLIQNGGYLDVSLAGAQSGWAPSSDANWRKARAVFINPSSSGAVVRGFKAEYTEDDFVYEKIIFNVSTVYSLALIHESDPVGTQQIRCPGNSNYVIGPRETCRLYYSKSHFKWIVLDTEYNPYVHQTGTSGSFTSFPTSTSDIQSWVRAGIFRWNGGADLTVSGFKYRLDVGGYDLSALHKKWLVNVTASYNIIIKHQDGAATALERIYTDTGEDIILYPGETATLIYSTSYGWYCSKPEPKGDEFESDSSTGTLDDHDWTGREITDWLAFVGSGNVILTGIEDADLRIFYKRILNGMASYTVTIKEEDAGSAADHRFYHNGLGDIVLNFADAAKYVWNSGISRWQLLTIERSSAPGTNVLFGAGASGVYDRQTPLQALSILDGGLAEQTLTDGATITNDVTAGRNAKVTITGTGKTLNFTNTVAGQRGIVRITQGDGSDTITTYQRAGVAGDVLFAGGAAPVLSTGAGDVDVLEWYDDGSKIYIRAFGLDFQ